MTNPITWQTITVKLSQIQWWDENPRQIKTDQADRLLDSYNAFGDALPLLLDPMNEDGLYPALDGHQRGMVWGNSIDPDLEVSARVASRPFTLQERKKLIAYLHSGATGEWDVDMVANLFDADELEEWGMPSFMFGEEVPEFKEYDESTADDVQYIECPHCKKEFPK